MSRWPPQVGKAWPGNSKTYIKPKASKSGGCILEPGRSRRYLQQGPRLKSTLDHFLCRFAACLPVVDDEVVFLVLQEEHRLWLKRWKQKQNSRTAPAALAGTQWRLSQPRMAGADDSDRAGPGAVWDGPAGDAPRGTERNAGS